MLQLISQQTYSCCLASPLIGPHSYKKEGDLLKGMNLLNLHLLLGALQRAPCHTRPYKARRGSLWMRTRPGLLPGQRRLVDYMLAILSISWVVAVNNFTKRFEEWAQHCLRLKLWGPSTKASLFISPDLSFVCDRQVWNLTSLLLLSPSSCFPPSFLLLSFCCSLFTNSRWQSDHTDLQERLPCRLLCRWYNSLCLDVLAVCLWFSPILPPRLPFCPSVRESGYADVSCITRGLGLRRGSFKECAPRSRLPPVDVGKN